MLSSYELTAIRAVLAAAASLGTGIGMERRCPLPDHVHQHVTAARAFHTDLIAHAQRRLRLLLNLAKHLNVLRSRNSSLAEKLGAAESSRKHLDSLDQLGRSSRETYSDFRSAVRRIHHHLNQLAAGNSRMPTEELAVPGPEERPRPANSQRATPSSSKDEGRGAVATTARRPA